jgi:hypothetical protein
MSAFDVWRPPFFPRVEPHLVHSLRRVLDGGPSRLLTSGESPPRRDELRMDKADSQILPGTFQA